MLPWPNTPNYYTCSGKISAKHRSMQKFNI
jgi:hypothetical protein